MRCNGLIGLASIAAMLGLPLFSGGPRGELEAYRSFEVVVRGLRLRPRLRQPEKGQPKQGQLK